ncbi:unnamed protein product, partial [Meganyctiphanes norvegica]
MHEYTHTHTRSGSHAVIKLSKFVSILALFGLASAASLYSGRSKGEQGSNEEVLQQLLRSFDGFKNEVKDHTGDGTYSFIYHVGDSEREELRSESGEVTGRFAFVAPEGNEIEAKYEADEEGFRVESDAIPIAPEDTDDVKAAKEEFFEAYEKAAEAAEAAGSYEYEEYEEYSDEESSEESSAESSEEDSDEESSEES